MTEYEVEPQHCLWLLWDKVEQGSTEAAFTRGEHRCGEPLDENCKKPTRTRDDIFSLLILNFLSYGLCIADVGSIDCLHSILRPNLLRIYVKEHLKVVDPDLQQGLLFPLLGGVAVVKTRTFTPWTPGPSPPL